MKELTYATQMTTNELPLDSCYLCKQILKECVCINFQIVDDAMDYGFERPGEQRFKIGNFVTAVPSLEAMHGEYVLAHNRMDNWTVFRKYIIQDDNQYLEALNPAYPKISLSPNIEIIGVVKSYHDNSI